MSIAREQRRFLEQRAAVDEAAAKRRLTLAIAGTQRVQTTLDALAGSDPLPLFQTRDGRTVSVDLSTLRRHALVLGTSGGGKSWLKALQFERVLSRACDRIARGAASDLGFEMTVVDVKSETAHLLKRFVAAAYVRGVPRVREVLREATHFIGWSQTRLTPLVAFGAVRDVSVEYQARIKADLLTHASRSAWSEAQHFLLVQTLRVIGELPQHTFTLRFVELLCRDEQFRLQLVAKLSSRDLADFFGHLPQRIAAQTLEAFIRRAAIELGYSLVRLVLGLPPHVIATLGLRQEAPLTLVDAGVSNALPPSIACALANWVLTDALFAASRRDPRVPHTIVLEEAVALLSMATDLLDLVLNGLRMLRSLNVNIEFYAQSLESLPQTAVREMLLNAVTVTAFQSPKSIGELLYPHVLRSSDDARSEADRKRDFLRDVEALPPQEAVLWAKGHPALRVRTLDLTPPECIAGVSAAELDDVFHREIAPQSFVDVRRATQLLDDYEGTLTREVTASRPTQPKAPASFRDLRSALGLDEGQDE